MCIYANRHRLRVWEIWHRSDWRESRLQTRIEMESENTYIIYLISNSSQSILEKRPLNRVSTPHVYHVNPLPGLHHLLLLPSSQTHLQCSPDSGRPEAETISQIISILFIAHWLHFALGTPGPTPSLRMSSVGGRVILLPHCVRQWSWNTVGSQITFVALTWASSADPLWA